MRQTTNGLLGCQRGSPTRPSDPNRRLAGAAPRSSGRRHRRGDSAALPELESQVIACRYLVRACRDALSDLSLELDPNDSRSVRAIDIVRAALADWSATLATLRTCARG